MKKLFNKIIYWICERRILRQRMAVRDSVSKKCQEELDKYKRTVIKAAEALNEKDTQIKKFKLEVTKLKIRNAVLESKVG